MQYNSQKDQLKMREYGRNVQNLIAYAKTVEDREERNAVVNSLVRLMGQMNPSLKNLDEVKHKLWDPLFHIADYDIDVDSPYPKPDEENFNKRPERMAYPKQRIRYRHYGKGVENLIEKAAKMEDDEMKQAFTQLIGKYMKLAYKSWNHDTVADETILLDLKTLSKGNLTLPDGTNLESSVKSRPKRKNNQNNNRNNNRNKNNNRNRRKK